MSSHYETLGVASDATPDEIKAAYRFQLKAFHPDKFPPNSGASQRAQDRVRQIIEAHAVLSDQNRRANYDRFIKYTSTDHPGAFSRSSEDARKGGRRSTRRLYLSANAELAELQQSVAAMLPSLDYEVTYRPGAGGTEDLRPTIRKQIDQSHVVVQLVGRSYGEEPPTVDPLIGRISYLQFEGAYARQRRKPIQYVFLADQFVVGTVITEPEDGTRLQEAYRRRLRIIDTHSWTQVGSAAELNNAVRSFAESLRRPAVRGVSWMWLSIAAIAVTVVGITIFSRERVSPNRIPATSPRSTDTNPTATSLPKRADTSGPVLAQSEPSQPAVTPASTLPAEQTDTASLLQITETELNPVTERELTLRLAVKARVKGGVDSAKVQVQVVFYDTVNQRITPTDAEISYEWFSGSPDWKEANPEQLIVRYRRGPESTALKTGRTYLGYIVRLYYSDGLQEVRAEPKTLLRVFPQTAATSGPLAPNSIDAIARGDFAEAARLFREASDRGDVFSKRELGRLYETGLGVQRNYYQAVALYTEAAELEYVKAIYDLGRMFHDGKGVSRDYAKAAELFDKAAARNDADALYALAWMRLRGEGVEQNDNVAAALLLKATEQRHAPAENMLGWLYTLGKGVPQDYIKALEFYDDAAAQDNVEAQLALAILYEEGKGVPADIQKTVEIYERLIARHDDPRAEVNLGWIYETGKRLGKDEAKAIDLYRKAASQGYPPGIAQLASCYAFGKGVTENYATARDLYEKAVAAGDGYALNDFAWFLATCPEQSQRDGRQAVKLATKACEQSGWQNANEMGTLAAAYAESGDFANAIKYQEKAISMIKGDFPDPAQMKEMLALFRQRKPYRELVTEPSTGPVAVLSNTDPQTVVVDLERKWAKAVQAHDAKVVSALLTEDYSTTTPAGRTLNRSAALERIERDTDHYTAVAVNTLDFRVKENEIVVTGVLDEQGHDKKRTAFRRTFSFTDTWIKSGDQWLCSKSIVRGTKNSDDSIQSRVRHSTPAAASGGPRSRKRNR